MECVWTIRQRASAVSSNSLNEWREFGVPMAQPSIYIFCPDLSRPMGGVRMLYRHVDILNANGFSVVQSLLPALPSTAS